VRAEGSLERMPDVLWDGNYGRYHELSGAWPLLPGVTLLMDHVQGDPFAGASTCRLQIDQAVARFPRHLHAEGGRVRNVAVCDFVLRAAHAAIRAGGWDDDHVEGAKGGAVRVLAPSQEVLESSAVLLSPDRLEIRLEASLPAFGRRIAGAALRVLLQRRLPELARALCYVRLDAAALEAHVRCAEDQEALRGQLGPRGLVAWVADGAMLARAAGDSDLPLRDGAVPFCSDPALRVTLTAPHSGALPGLGLPAGVTLVVGGGFHGKSTLLRALEMGVYNHIPGDGRERVVTLRDAVKVRAEDGRSVTGVDISRFISNLPLGKDTRRFSTACASGSTSQAAAVVEALECGAPLLLVDEDTSATNFMIRDERMRQLVPDADETISPFVLHVREAFVRSGVSSILVMGGSSDYLPVASLVLQMRNYQPLDITARARALAPLLPAEPPGPPLVVAAGRRLAAVGSACTGPKGRPKLRAMGRGLLLYGDAEINVAAVEQLPDRATAYAVARCIWHLFERLRAGGSGAREAMHALDAALDAQSLTALSARIEEPDGFLKRPRAIDVIAAINRMRSLQVNS
jgi:predicted ABC-class ATPase